MGTERSEVFSQKVLEKLYGRSPATPTSSSSDRVEPDVLSHGDIERTYAQDTVLPGARDTKKHLTESPSTGGEDTPHIKVYGAERGPLDFGTRGPVSSVLQEGSLMGESECSGCKRPLSDQDSSDNWKTDCIQQGEGKLTKNQKRKLKKKKRKEKMKAKADDNEFVYIQQHSRSPSPNQPHTKETATEPDRDKLAQFWSNIWELYHREARLLKGGSDSAPSDEGLVQLLESIRSDSREILEHIDSVRRALVRGDRAAVQDRVQHMSHLSGSRQDVCDVLEVLSEYWITNVLGIPRNTS